MALANGAAAGEDTVITATLVRGKTYSYFLKSESRYIAFKRNVPVEVPASIVDELEELSDTVHTDDGDEIEKPLFNIDRAAERRAEDEERPRRMRMRIVPVEESAKPKVVARRAPPPGVGGLRRSGSGG